MHERFRDKNFVHHFKWKYHNKNLFQWFVMLLLSNWFTCFDLPWFFPKKYESNGMELVHLNSGWGHRFTQFFILTCLSFPHYKWSISTQLFIDIFDRNLEKKFLIEQNKTNGNDVNDLSQQIIQLYVCVQSSNVSFEMDCFHVYIYVVVEHTEKKGFNVCRLVGRLPMSGNITT